MNVQEALEALNNGDFKTAASVLEAAARQTGFTSEILNHAYTLALYRSGDKPQLADAAYRIGSAMAQDDPASAMDYFQRSLQAGLGADRVQKIAEIFEGWAAPPHKDAVVGRVDRVAHVVGCLVPDQPLASYLRLLTSGLLRKGVQSTIFTTESTASWFLNPPVVQSQSLPIDADIQIASVEGDFIERAQKIADAIRSSGIKIAFFHGSLAEQITARVAAMRPVPLQVSVNHGSDVEFDAFDGFIRLFQSAMACSRFSSHPAEWIPPTSDIETRLHLSEPVTRQSFGLDSASSVSATCVDLQKVTGSRYLRALTEIMKRFPKHFHLFAGSGNVKAIRSTLHSEGVLPRVRFLGEVGDIAPLLSAIDVYLAFFPDSGCNPIMEAMGAGKPIVVHRFPPDLEYNSGAELVGVRELTAPGEADYIEIASRLLRDPAQRHQQGETMSARFRSEFSPERQAERYIGFLNRLVTPK